MMSIASIARGIAATLNALRADRRGSVAWLMAGAIIPLVAAIGLSVDGARGWLVKSRLSQAIDAAGLAGGRVISSDSRDADIQMFFNANFPPNFMQAQVDGPHIDVDGDEATITINARATISTTFMRVVGINELTVSAKTVVQRMDRGMELVLVIDNTGSMINKAKSSDTKTKIEAVRDAANILVNSVYGNRETVDNLWVGVVPYVATVNIGNALPQSDWAVVRSAPSYTVNLVRTRVTSSSATSIACATVASGGTHTFHDGQIIDISGASTSAYNVRALIRLTSLTASSPNPDPCRIEQTGPSSEKNKKFWYVITTGSSSTTPVSATASVPSSDYPTGTSWSGCVEARVPPYEEAEAETLPVSTTPATMWTRYYWPSTRGVKFFQTDRQTQFPLVTPSGFTSLGTQRYGDNDWKGYNGIGNMSPIAREIGADYWAYGPNFGCGQPILPLQQSKAAVQNKINAMLPWGRSGTMSNLGLAWGWRVISPLWKDKWGSQATPGHPVPYPEPLISKVVVLLTDGKNEWVDYPNVLPGCSNGNGTISNCIGNNGHPNDADHTAYGRLAEKRFGPGVNTIAEASVVINDRMKSLCTAMKATGITIYTVVLQENDPATKQLFEDCASDPAFAYFPEDASKLTQAFKQISDQLANLRLAQ